MYMYKHTSSTKRVHQNTALDIIIDILSNTENIQKSELLRL